MISPARVFSFTGHRKIPESIATAGIDEVLDRLKPTSALVGGAMGADSLAAERCWKFNVPYVMVLPHREYPDQYKLRDNPRWATTMLCAKEVIYVVEDKPWHFSHNFKRNEWMVDHSNRLICVSKFDPFLKIPAKGGTAHCVRYARKVKRTLEWVNLAGASAPQPQLYS